MAACTRCKKTGFGYFEVKEGLCPSCRKAMAAEEANKSDADRQREKVQQRELVEKAAAMPVTTETWVGDVERLGIVASEVVLGMNVLKDLMANVRDIIGGRSGVVQETLLEDRQTALDEIRVQASELDADAVIATSINYHSISTGSSLNMMIVAVTGTAVRWGSAKRS